MWGHYYYVIALSDNKEGKKCANRKRLVVVNLVHESGGQLNIDSGLFLPLRAMIDPLVIGFGGSRLLKCAYSNIY